MAENTVKKIATRESYGNSLKELAEEFPNLVVLDADLAAATKTGIFRKAYPDRHIDCGIAEENMMGVAAGLSLVGKIPFVSSFAMFAAGRAFEQVRNSIGYPHLNVKIGATHAGISVGEDGATHQCNEDIALMRSIPGMVVLSPSDDVEARAAVIAAYNYNGPVYLRFSRLATPVFHDPETYEFQIGKGEKLTDGYDIAVISTGLMTNEALRAADFAPYYLYRQKYMSGSFENVGWCISGAEGLYNIYIMEELHSILSLGAGGSTKMVDAARGRIERVFHAKYPHEYITRPEKIQENLETFRRFHEQMLQK